MEKTVLHLRLENLSAQLRDASQDTWLASLNLDLVASSIHWQTAMKAVSGEAEDLAVGLDEALKDLSKDPSTAAAAWHLYFRTKARSDDIFREYLMILGGLALRDRMKNELICPFADELIRECALSVGRPTSFAIPAFDDAISSTLRRVARIAFPDLNLWTLPLVAHEYGHIVLRETQLEKLVKELVTDGVRAPTLAALNELRQSIGLPSNLRDFGAKWITQAEGAIYTAPQILQQMANSLAMLGEDSPPRVQEIGAQLTELLSATTTRVRVLLADAFATYTCGPAYANAAILLRLSPAQPGSRDRPPDSSRADTILAMLGAMGEGHGGPQRFQQTEAWLRSAWEMSTTSIDVPADDGAAAHIEIDADYVLDRMRFLIPNPKAEYDQENWNAATNLGSKWQGQIAAGETLEVQSSASLRDVINAAWWARSLVLSKFDVETVDSAVSRIVTAATACCEKRVEVQPDADGGVFLRKSHRPPVGEREHSNGIRPVR